MQPTPTAPSSHPHIPNEWGKYIRATTVSLVLFFALSCYLYLRRGYYDLYIANKAFAGISLMLVGIVLLIGPLTRLYQRFDTWILYRKHVGIVAFVYALLHSIISLLMLPDHFSMSYYLKFPPQFIFGLIGSSLLVWLSVISFRKITDHLEKHAWWYTHNWGVRLAGTAIMLHILIMKYAGWIKWYTDGGGKELLRPYMMPAGALVGSFGIFVFVVRLAEFTGPTMARSLVKIVTALYIVFIMGSFVWGYTKTPQALPLDWETCIKLPVSTIQESYPATCIGTGGRRAIQPINN
jgi:DMSO/TMAO reductase YedYZ heme-binding membrane subunit